MKLNTIMMKMLEQLKYMGKTMKLFFYVQLIREVVFWLCHIAKEMIGCTIVMTVFQMTLSEKHFLKKLKIKIYNSL